MQLGQICVEQDMAMHSIRVGIISAVHAANVCLRGEQLLPSSLISSISASVLVLRSIAFCACY